MDETPVALNSKQYSGRFLALVSSLPTFHQLVRGAFVRPIALKQSKMTLHGRQAF
jgi:hypothetical protein